jgi:hypothetical protein
MTPEKPDAHPSPDLFRNRLDNMLNHRHELYRLADLIDWPVFDTEFGSLYCPDNGCPAKATRLMVGLQCLKQVYGVSDEAVVRLTIPPAFRISCAPTWRFIRSSPRRVVLTESIRGTRAGNCSLPGNCLPRGYPAPRPGRNPALGG